MEKLNEEKLMHVAKLARLSLTDEEKDKYSNDLALILNDIEKLTDENVDGYEAMITPSINKDMYSDGEVSMIDKEEAFKNSKLSDGDYIVVPKVIND